MSTKQFDILIVGGGIVGLTLANTLKDSGLGIGIIEQREPATVSKETDLRVSAIHRASLRVFESIDVLPELLNQRVCAYREMHVWDSTGVGEIHFDSAEQGLDSLGYIIENSVILQALLAGIQNSESVDWLCPLQISSIELSDQFHRINLATGDSLECKCLVGADGANSSVRAAAGIDFYHSSYDQMGIVCTVATELEHRETAWQCFLPSGPLAFLPLSDGRCSIVWSLDEANAAEILALDDETFSRQLEQAFEYQLGAVTSVSERATFPLGHGHVKNYVQHGLALLGDAAHTIHPLAGQGANLGIMDAACLAGVIQQAHSKNREWAAKHNLRRYERARKSDNRLMETAMSGFKLLFGNDNPLLVSVRNAGLNLTDSLPLVKYQLMRYAMGFKQDSAQHENFL